jgi:hypothetical protein
MTLFLIFLSGVLDRIRGSGYNIMDQRIVNKLTYGWVIAGLLGHIGDALTFPIAALFSVGISIALSEPIGAALDGRAPNQNKLEWYMVGPFARYAWPALILRGAMTGAPLLMLWHWLPSVWIIIPAYAAAFPMAVLTARYMPAFMIPAVFPERWACQEYMRGWIGAIAITALRGFFNV